MKSTSIFGVKSKIMMLFALMFTMFLALAINSYAITDCNLTFPTNVTFDYDGEFELNTSVSRTEAENITNVSWTIGTSVFFNSTRINGTVSPSSNASDFTYNLNATDLDSGSFTIYTTCYNSSDLQNNDVSKNSTSRTYTVDTLNPLVELDRPTAGASVTPAGGEITFEYTPTETNLGNCSLYLDDALLKSSTSGTRSPNITSGSISSFKKEFTSDNSSVSWRVECIDLAGLKANSTSRTLNVIVFGGQPLEITVTGGVATAEQPQQIQPQSIAGQTQQIAGQISSFTDSLKQQWALPIIIIIISLLGFALYKIYNKK